jgi:hypothetical protein
LRRCAPAIAHPLVHQPSDIRKPSITLYWPLTAPECSFCIVAGRYFCWCCYGLQQHPVHIFQRFALFLGTAASIHQFPRISLQRTAERTAITRSSTQNPMVMFGSYHVRFSWLVIFRYYAVAPITPRPSITSSFGRFPSIAGEPWIWVGYPTLSQLRLVTIDVRIPVSLWVGVEHTTDFVIGHSTPLFVLEAWIHPLARPITALPRPAAHTPKASDRIQKLP